MCEPTHFSVLPFMTKSYIIPLPTVMAWWKVAACVAEGIRSVIWEYHLRLSAETATYWTQHNHRVNTWQQLELPLSPPWTMYTRKWQNSEKIHWRLGENNLHARCYHPTHAHTHARTEFCRLHHWELNCASRFFTQWALDGSKLQTITYKTKS